MTITQKLKRLCEDRNRSAVARRAGIRPVILHRCIRTNQKPRYDTAVKIAHAIGVSVDWLLDDAKDWPPIFVNHPDAAGNTPGAT